MNDGGGTLAAGSQGRNFGPLGTALVIIPTYNEAENIKAIVGRVRKAVPYAHVLVADDNSPDGTGKLADELAAEDENVQVLHRKGKEGLGAAYLAGFRWGLEHGYGVLVEMDADGSHQPEELPRLLTALKGADLVLGSRWVPGGRVGQLAEVAGGHLARRQPLLAAGARPAAARHHRRLPRVPPGDPGGSRPRRGGLPGLLLPGRPGPARGEGRLPRRRGAHHLRRARARRLEDEPRHPRRGAVAGHRVGRGERVGKVLGRADDKPRQPRAGKAAPVEETTAGGDRPTS